MATRRNLTKLWSEAGLTGLADLVGPHLETDQRIGTKGCKGGTGNVSTATGAASGRARVRNIADVPSRARNSLHRPTRFAKSAHRLMCAPPSRSPSDAPHGAAIENDSPQKISGSLLKFSRLSRPCQRSARLSPNRHTVRGLRTIETFFGFMTAYHVVSFGEERPTKKD